MENIIEINGIRYQRVDTESEVNVPEKGIDRITSDDVCAYNGLVYEDDIFCFEATKFLDKDGVPYEDFYVEFTNKLIDRSSRWDTEYMDSSEFFKGLLEGDDESEEMCLEIMNEYQMGGLKSLLLYIEEIGW